MQSGDERKGFGIQKFIFTIFSHALLLSVPVLALTETQVTIEAALNATKIPVNREVVFTVTASWTGQPGDIEFETVEPPEVSNLALISTASSNRIQPDGAGTRAVREYVFRYRPEGLGMAYVDVVELKYRDRSGEGHSLYTSRVSVRITGPVREPLPNWSIPITLVGVVLLLLAALAVYQYNARKNRELAIQAREEESISPEERFAEEMRATLRLDGTAAQEDYAALSATLRRYLAEIFSLEVDVLTTKELVDRLEASGVELASIQQIRAILEACDLVKFTGSPADPAQLTRLAGQAESLIRGGIKAKSVLPGSTTNS